MILCTGFDGFALQAACHHRSRVSRQRLVLAGVHGAFGIVGHKLDTLDVYSVFEPLNGIEELT